MLGGWQNINEAHYRLIAKALDRHRGAGERILITFGASHKYWFLDEHRRREDIALLDPLTFFAGGATLCKYNKIQCNKTKFCCDIGPVYDIIGVCDEE